MALSSDSRTICYTRTSSIYKSALTFDTLNVHVKIEPVPSSAGIHVPAGHKTRYIAWWNKDILTLTR